MLHVFFWCLSVWLLINSVSRICSEGEHWLWAGFLYTCLLFPKQCNNMFSTQYAVIFAKIDWYTGRLSPSPYQSIQCFGALASTVHRWHIPLSKTLFYTLLYEGWLLTFQSWQVTGRQSFGGGALYLLLSAVYTFTFWVLPWSLVKPVVGLQHTYLGFHREKADEWETLEAMHDQPCDWQGCLWQ